MKKYKVISIVLLLFLVFSEMIFFLKTPQSKGKTLSVSDIQDVASIRSKILASINDRGEKETYTLLKSEFYESSEKDAHRAFHIFGETLFDKSGTDGVAICDSSFGFGCFHGFFSSALANTGVGVLPEADRMCITSFGEGALGCQHGIGHGVLEYFGSSRLDEALKACSMLTWKGKYMGCVDGVFMEYNFPTSINNQGESDTTRRVYDSSKPFKPCNDVDGKFRRACFYNLPSFWAKIVKNKIEIGNLCKDIVDPAGFESCFLGLGKSIAEDNDYNIDKSLSDCNVFAKNAALLCRAGVGWTIFASGFKTSWDINEACANLIGSELEYCRKYLNLYEAAKNV